jgi:hypothetical protein
LGRLLLDTARRAKTSPRDLSAVTGLHHATVRAMIARAAGNGLPDGWTQPELAIKTKPGRTAPPSPAVTPAQRPQTRPASSPPPTRPLPPALGM